jgi:hypothetical protein
MPNILLQLYSPYLSPLEADEIRAEGLAMKPQICLVMADWPWIELRGLDEKQTAAFLEGLKARGVKFRVLATSKKNTKTKVQVSETLTVC